jgi:hypothetical protein
MGRNARRAGWIAASIAVVPMAAVATWWLVGDATEVDPEFASYLFRAPDIEPATERAAGLVATLLVVAYLIAALAAAVRAVSLDTYLGAAVCLVAAGALIGVFARILTAGVDGANIGGGFVLVFGLPLLLLLLALALVLARITGSRRAVEEAYRAAPANARTTRLPMVIVAGLGVLIAVVGAVRVSEGLPVTADQLAHTAARRVRTILRSGALAAPPGTNVETVPQCGARTAPSVDSSYRSVEATSIVDALTEQLLTAGWDVHELRDGYRRYRNEHGRWAARLSMIEKSADGGTVTLHLDVQGDADADCGTYRKDLATERG